MVKINENPIRIWLYRLQDLVHHILRAGCRSDSKQVWIPGQLKYPVLLISCVKEFFLLLRGVEATSGLQRVSRMSFWFSWLWVLWSHHRALGAVVHDGCEVGVALHLCAGHHFRDRVPSDATATGSHTLGFILSHWGQQGIVVTFGSHHGVLGNNLSRFRASNKTLFC